MLTFLLTIFNVSDGNVMVGREGSVGIATELQAGRSGDRIPVGARFSASVQTGPRVHPASCTVGAGYFPGVKWPGHGANPPI